MAQVVLTLFSLLLVSTSAAAEVAEDSALVVRWGTSDLAVVCGAETRTVETVQGRLTQSLVHRCASGENITIAVLACPVSREVTESNPSCTVEPGYENCAIWHNATTCTVPKDCGANRGDPYHCHVVPRGFNRTLAGTPFACLDRPCAAVQIVGAMGPLPSAMWTYGGVAMACVVWTVASALAIVAVHDFVREM